MPRFNDWDTGGTSRRSGGDGSVFLNLQPGKYRVRLISKPIQYFQFWEIEGKKLVCRSPYMDENEKVICPLMQLGYTPKERYSYWVFDRDDDNKIKLMDFPPSLYDYFKEWFLDHKEEPGGPNGCDWRVTIEAPSGSQQYKKYKAMPLDRVAFTEGEIKQIKEGNLKNRLLELRRDNTPDEIRKMMADAGIGQVAAAPDTKHESRVTTSQPASQPEVKTETPATDSSAGSSSAASGDGFPDMDW